MKNYNIEKEKILELSRDLYNNQEISYEQLQETYARNFIVNTSN